jgi:hypothetical protein
MHVQHARALAPVPRSLPNLYVIAHLKDVLEYPWGQALGRILGPWWSISNLALHSVGLSGTRLAIREAAGIAPVHDVCNKRSTNTCITEPVAIAAVS